jgi:hypothetical protein
MYIANPLDMISNLPNRKSDRSGITLVEFRLLLGKSDDFGGANRCKITWMREKYGPSFVDVIVEVNFIFR